MEGLYLLMFLVGCLVAVALWLIRPKSSIKIVEGESVKDRKQRLWEEGLYDEVEQEDR